MRQLAVTLAPIALLGGCSLLYNPDNLPPAADADIPIPKIDPSLIEVESAAPAEILEGVGTGGGRPAVVVIAGKNMVKDNTTVEILKTGTEEVQEGMTILMDQLDVSIDGFFLAVPVVQDVIEGFEGSVEFDVRVTQNAPNTPTGRASWTRQNAIQLRGLPELIHDDTNTDLLLESGVKEYSKIEVRAKALVAPTTGFNEQTQPVVLRSMSLVTITGPVRVGASGQRGGAGGGAGGRGGDGGLLGGTDGTPGQGPHGGANKGGDASFEVGDPGLSTLGLPLRGSGGGGGAQGLSNGGAGGGGGGSIEITARGNLTVGVVDARGSAGLSGASQGGGGSGGVILLRAGGELKTGSLDVSGGGGGVPGRARFDAGVTATVPSGANHYRGPMFEGTPLITRSPKPEFTILGKQSANFGYFFVQGGNAAGPFSGIIGADKATFALGAGLFRGLNQVCVFVEPPGSTSSETRNCIDIAFLRSE